MTVAGWVETVRDQKKVQFVILRDESGSLQLVRPRPAPDAETGRATTSRRRSRRLTLGSFVPVSGELKHDERVKLGGIEVKIDDPRRRSARRLPENPIADDCSIDKRLDWRFLDLRRPEQALIFRIQTTFEHALRTYWVEHGFIEIHTPKLMASACESRAELFEVDVLRGQRPTWRRARSSSSRWRSRPASARSSRSAPRSAPTRRSPRGTRPSSRASTPRSAGSTPTRTSWRCTRSCSSPASRRSRTKHGDEIEALFGVELDRAVDAVPAHPARRGEADRRRARLRRAARRRRHGPRGRAPDLRVREGGPTATTSSS